MDNVTISTQEMLNMMAIMQESIKKSAASPVGKSEQVSGLAVYLLHEAGFRDIAMPDGTPIQKSEIDEITADFTRGRTLSEEQNAIQLRFIFDKSPFLKMFNSRIVNKLVTPIEGRAITRKNLISYEQNGSTSGITPNRRIVHDFGVNLYLRHTQLQKDIPLQTIINNLYNPTWEAGVMNDIATAFSNDILLLVVNGLSENYANTKNFYDLNKGFMKILQDASGSETNTYGSIKVSGFLGKHLTPHKLDTTTYTSSYNPANLLSAMRKMYKMMPIQYRSNPNNVWMLSQYDYDMYVESRSDMTSPSNTTREQNLTNGITPRFMGHEVIAIPEMPGISEVHEASSTVNGSIIFGDPKNIDVASDKMTFLKTSKFNARGSAGPVYEFTYDMYFDTQVVRPESFVIGFNGATVTTPYLVTADGYNSGNTGLISSTEGKYNNAGSNLVAVPVCDSHGAVIVKSPTTLAAATTLAEALLVQDASIVPEGTALTLNADTYFKAYMRDGSAVASAQVWFDKAI